MRPLTSVSTLIVVAVILGAGFSRAQAPAPPVTAGAPEGAVERSSQPFAARFPNLVLRTHQGKSVRFYDDLLKGKVVLINFMYASCKGR